MRMVVTIFYYEGGLLGAPPPHTEILVDPPTPIGYLGDTPKPPSPRQVGVDSLRRIAQLRKSYEDK
jgi:hypothetical protein